MALLVRICAVCGQTKPLSRFYQDGRVCCTCEERSQAFHIGNAESMALIKAARARRERYRHGDYGILTPIIPERFRGGF